MLATYPHFDSFERGHVCIAVLAHNGHQILECGQASMRTFVGSPLGDAKTREERVVRDSPSAKFATREVIFIARGTVASGSCRGGG